MSVFLSLWNTFFVTGHLVTILLFFRGKRLLSSCTATYATKHNVFLLKEGRKYIVPYILSSKYTTYIYCMFQNSLPQVLCPHEDGHKSFILACSLCSNRVEGSRVLRIFMHCLKLTITKAIRLPNWKVPKDSNSHEPPNVLQATPYQFEFLSCIHHIWRPACLSASSPCLLTYLLKIECRCHEKSKRKKALCLFQVNHLDTYRGWQVAEPLEATAATPRRGLYSFRWGQGAPPELWGSFSIWRWRTIRLTHRPPLSSHSFSSRACQENLVQFDQRWESRSCKSVNTL